MTTPHMDPVHTMVVGVFDDTAAAKCAVDDLCRVGFSENQVDVTCPGARPRAAATHELSPDASGDWLDDEIAAGHTVVMVRNADERADEVRDLLRKDGGTIREPSTIGTYGTGVPATPY